jgi:hypothetical protein
MIRARSSSGVARRPRTLGAALLLLGLFALPTVGCQQFALGSEEPERLLTEARASLQRGDQEAAYRHLKRIRTEYPESPECDVAFPWAASLWKELWFRDRYSQPDSAWITVEPEFLFDWLASYFDEVEEFPRREADALLRGMPWSVYQRSAAHADTRPEFSGWVLRVEEDDGHIRSVEGERVQASAR